MHRDCHNDTIDRAIALHKMIRLYTLAGGGEAYLNFMGNEFGHPEWIDFPREGNGWSFHYCRRQWSLPDNTDLKYQYLNAFDKDLISLSKEVDLFRQKMGDLRYSDPYRQIIVFYRKGLLFAFNFSPTNSYTDVEVSLPNYADYTVAFTSDDWKYGGWGQINHGAAPARIDEWGNASVSLYLPARTAVVLRECEIKKTVKETVQVRTAEKKTAPVKKTGKRNSTAKKLPINNAIQQ